MFCVKSFNVEGSATWAELSWSRLGWAELAYWSLRAFLCGLHSLVMILRRGSLVNKRGWHQVPCKVHIKLLDKFCCNAPSMYVAAAIMLHFRTNQIYEQPPKLEKMIHQSTHIKCNQASRQSWSSKDLSLTAACSIALLLMNQPFQLRGCLTQS